MGGHSICTYDVVQRSESPDGKLLSTQRPIAFLWGLQFIASYEVQLIVTAHLVSTRKTLQSRSDLRLVASVAHVAPPAHHRRLDGLGVWTSKLSD